MHLQAILNYMMSLGLLPPLRHGETALFAVTAGALMWMYKKGTPKVTMVQVRNIIAKYPIKQYILYFVQIYFLPCI